MLRLNCWGLRIEAWRLVKSCGSGDKQCSTSGQSLTLEWTELGGFEHVCRRGARSLQLKLGG